MRVIIKVKCNKIIQRLVQLHQENTFIYVKKILSCQKVIIYRLKNLITYGLYRFLCNIKKKQQVYYYQLLKILAKLKEQSQSLLYTIEDKRMIYIINCTGLINENLALKMLLITDQYPPIQGPKVVGQNDLIAQRLSERQFKLMLQLTWDAGNLNRISREKIYPLDNLKGWLNPTARRVKLKPTMLIN